MKSTKFLLLAAWLCLSLGAYAQTTYYVATTGSNTEGVANDPDNPFATIEYVVEELANLDDTIQVLTGSYTENNIAIESPSLTISGLGQDVTVMLADGSNNLFSIAANGVIIEGLNITGPGTDSGATGIFFLNVNPEGVENDTIRQNTISGFQSGIRFADAADISGLAISNNFINANATGISIGNGVSFANVNAATGTIYENNLSGNTTALANNSNNLVNASANFWVNSNFGSVIKPGDITPIIGSVNRVDYNPWLTNSTDIDDQTDGFQGSYFVLGTVKTNTSSNALQEAYRLLQVVPGVTSTIQLHYPVAGVSNLSYGDIEVNDKSFLLEAIGNPTLNNITTNGASLIIDGSLKASSLTLIDGDIEAQDQLILPRDATISEAPDALLLGQVTTEAFTLGADEAYSFLGAEISASDVGGDPLNSLTVSRTTGTPITLGDDKSIRVVWRINVSNAEFTERILTLRWSSVYDNDINFEGINGIVWKKSEGSTTWQAISEQEVGLDENGLHVIQAPNITSFSEFTVTDEASTLPVELTSFSASLLEPHVELNWETASEINSDFFSVERSENGKDFKEIGTLKAAGDSDVPLQYRYIDEQASKRFSGSLFYRLRTVDFDGSFEYSDITIVTISDDDLPMITAFAREGQQSLKLFTRGIEAGDYRVWITDLSGRKIFEQDLQLAPKEAYEIGIGSLPQSVYLIRCVGKQLALSTKFRVEEVN